MIEGGGFWYTGKKDGSLTPAVHESQAAAEQWIADREKVDPEGVARGDYYLDPPGDDADEPAAVVFERSVGELTDGLADGEYGGKFILITGNPVDGFNHEGPFETHDDGVLYAERTDDGVESWWVVPLHAPTRENEERPSPDGPGCPRHEGDPHHLCPECWNLEPESPDAAIEPCRCVNPDNCFCTPAQKAARVVNLP